MCRLVSPMSSPVVTNKLFEKNNKNEEKKIIHKLLVEKAGKVIKERKRK